MRHIVRYFYVPQRFFTRYGESMRIKCYFLERFGWWAPAVRLRSSSTANQMNFCGAGRVVVPDRYRELLTNSDKNIPKQ